MMKGKVVMPPVSIIMDLIAQIAIKDGAVPMHRHLSGWERKVDEHWTVFVNGQDRVIKWHGFEVPQYHAAVEFNGWPAGLLSPFDGAIAAGTAANEETFITALRQELRRPR